MNLGTDCIPFTGCITKYGYGWQTHEQKNWLAHRLAWVKAFGPIPDGQVVRHKCDNRKCINLDHLELGTQKDNIHDALDRGRFPVGATRSIAVLSSEDVEYVRSVFIPRHPTYGGAALARKYGVNQATMSRIIHGHTYK